MKHISHSGLMLWRRDKDEFYCKYLSPNKPPRIAETLPMLLGSGFDLLVKKELGYDGGAPDPRVREAAEDVFKQYKDSGSFSSLLRLLDKIGGVVRCEERVTKEFYGADGSVDFVLQGVPDLWVEGKKKLVLDWKVNGYYSSAALKGGYVWSSKTRSEGRGVVVRYVDGVPVGERLGDWEEQLVGYSWLVGSESPTIGCVDQLAFDDRKINVGRSTKVLGVGVGLYNEYKEVWGICNSGWIFRDLGIEESAAKCERLDQRAAVFSEGFDRSGFLKGVFGRV